MLHRRFFLVLLGSFLLLFLATSVFAAPILSSWEEAESLESVPGNSQELNTRFVDGCPILTRDGLQLYMASNRQDGLDLDIWVAERERPDEPFGDPVMLPAPINSEYNDFCPSPLRDGHGFMFVSNRPGACGGTGADIYLTRRHPVYGWEEPVNLGCDVNSPANEAGPVLVFAESGPPTLYFSSSRPDTPGGMNLYQSQMAGGWTFGPAVLVSGVNSDADDMQPYVSQDGRELVFASNRPDSQGFDIWAAVRDSIHDAWSEPFNLGPNLNSAWDETRPSLSWDGMTLLFGTNREGVEGFSDIFYSSREPVNQIQTAYLTAEVQLLWLPLLNR